MHKGSAEIGKRSPSHSFGHILVTKQFEFEQKEIVRQAVNGYAQGKGDFADYLIGLINHESGCVRTVTFDRGLRNAPLFDVLD